VTGDDLLLALAGRNSGFRVPFLSWLLGGTRSVLLPARGRGDWSPQLCGHLPNLTVCPTSALFQLSCACLIKEPHGERPFPPLGLWRCRELRGALPTWDRELDFARNRRQSLRQGPLLAALAGERPYAALPQTILHRLVEPEQAACAQGLAPCCPSHGRWRAGGWR